MSQFMQQMADSSFQPGVVQKGNAIRCVSTFTVFSLAERARAVTIPPETWAYTTVIRRRFKYLT